MKSFQATWTITKYNDNIHNGNKRILLLNLYVIWIEMLMLIICFYKVCLDLFLFAFSFPPVNVVFFYYYYYCACCMSCDLFLRVEFDLFLSHFIVFKNLIKKWGSGYEICALHCQLLHQSLMTLTKGKSNGIHLCFAITCNLGLPCFILRGRMILTLYCNLMFFSFYSSASKVFWDDWFEAI